MRLAILSFVLLCLWANATDLSESEKKQVMDNLSHEYTTCSAYYTTAAAAATLSGDKKKGTELLNASSAAMERAGITAQHGRSRDMAIQVVTARYGIETKRMDSEIGNDVSNISLLIAKYGDRCTMVMHDEDALIEEWVRNIEARR